MDKALKDFLEILDWGNNKKTIFKCVFKKKIYFFSKY